MTIATFSQAAKMMGYKSRSTLYRLKRDGFLSDYLIEVNGRDQLLLAPHGLPELPEYLSSVVQWRAGNVIPIIARDRNTTFRESWNS